MTLPAYASPTSPGKLSGEVPFGPVLVDNAGGASGDYARAVRLSGRRPGRSRALLATFPQSGFPIFRSDDDGRTWRQLSEVTGGGFWLQPYLYELPRAFAGLPKGAVLCAGNEFKFGPPFSTNIELFASTDQGLTWQYLSTVAVGGAPVPDKASTQVFEPFLLLHRDRLICYYSDERDPKYSQKLAHQSSADLRNWGPIVNDSVGTDSSQRPGMITISPMSQGQWIMTHEAGGNAGADNFYAVHYKIAGSPEEFGPADEHILHDQDGYVPSAAPVVAWSDSGDPMGTIVVTANSDKDLFINRAQGDPDKWTRLSSPMPRGYSRFTIPLASPGSWRRPGLVFVVTGPPYGENGPIQAGVIPLQ